MSRLPPYQFRGGLAVVTGAADGIGEQLANQFAVRGSHLHLIDRDEAGGASDRKQNGVAQADSSPAATDQKDRAAT